MNLLSLLGEAQTLCIDDPFESVHFISGEQDKDRKTPKVIICPKIEKDYEDHRTSLEWDILESQLLDLHKRCGRDLEFFSVFVVPGSLVISFEPDGNKYEIVFGH